ncbi:hypothetical protein OAK08_02060 [Candidatus Pelagibacter sp.]|nr:hypothetical protein [Candidatus Pelagibacter sp.]
MIIKNNIIEIIIPICILFLLLLSSDPVHYPDSSRYLSGSLIDPPFYSTIIIIMKFVFGSLNSVIIFQTLIIGFGIIYFTKTFAIHFKLNTKVKIFISILLFLPIIKFYNNLLTEPISYAFSLLLASFIVKLIFNFNIQNLIWSSIFAILLLLTRHQFMFIYPVIFLIYLTIIIQKSSKKIFVYLIASFFAIILVNNFLNFANNHIKKDILKADPLIYEGSGPFYFIFIDAVYISKVEDSELFTDQNLRKVVNTLIKEMDNRKALINHYNGRGHFGQSFKEIRNYSKDMLINLSVEENIPVIKLKKNISIKLILVNYKEYIKHIFKKFYDSTWLFIFLPFFMSVIGLMSFIKYRSKLSQVVLFISTFSLTNHSVVYLFGRVQPRYLIYSDFILLIFIFIIFYVFLQKKKSDRI